MKENFKSGFAAIIGRPNVGKSTLMNHLIGQKIAITSKKPQTTRNRIQTVYTCEDGQIVFLDTPGIHKAKNKLGEYMVQVAERTLKDVDVILWLVEPTTFIGAGERHIAEQLKGLHLPVILMRQRCDLYIMSFQKLGKLIHHPYFIAPDGDSLEHRIYIKNPYNLKPSFFKLYIICQGLSQISGTDNDHMMRLVKPQDFSDLRIQIWNIIAISLLSETAEIIQILAYLGSGHSHFLAEFIRRDPLHTLFQKFS